MFYWLQKMTLFGQSDLTRSDLGVNIEYFYSGFLWLRGRDHRAQLQPNTSAGTVFECWLRSSLQPWRKPTLPVWFFVCMDRNLDAFEAITVDRLLRQTRLRLAMSSLRSASRGQV
jgi:hypothetical protein